MVLKYLKREVDVFRNRRISASQPLHVIFPLMQYPKLSEPDLDNLQTFSQEPISESHEIIKSSFTEHCTFVGRGDFLYVHRYVARQTNVVCIDFEFLSDELSDAQLCRKNYCMRTLRFIPHTYVKVAIWRDWTHLDYLLVNPRHQSKRIGQSIVASVEDISQKFESKGINLHAVPSSIGFWKKQGFLPKSYPKHKFDTTRMVKYHS